MGDTLEVWFNNVHVAELTSDGPGVKSRQLKPLVHVSGTAVPRSGYWG